VEKDQRIGSILNQVNRLTKLDFEAKGTISEKEDDLDKIVEGLNALGEKLTAQASYIQDSQKRMNSLLDILMRYTIMDFSQKMPLSQTGDEIDAIAAGLNVLREELEYSLTEERKNRKELEEKNRKLNFSEERFRLMVQNVKDYAIFVFDTEGNVLSWNEGAQHLTGYSENEILGKNISIFYTAKDKAKGTPNLNMQMAKKSGHYEQEGYRVKKDGSPFWANVTYSAIYNSDKQLTGFSKVTRDMTKQRLASEELKETNNFLDSVLENIPNMIFVKDAEKLTFLRFNKAGEKLLGHTKKDMLGKSDYDFFPKEQADFFTSNDKNVLSQNDIVDIPEEPVNTKTGQRWLHTKKIPILSPSGKPAYLLGISEDITDMRQAMLDLAQKTRELERSNSELEQFAYVASHDLQEPLRTITSYLQLLAARYKDKLDKDADDFIDFAVDGSKRMKTLINSLLDYSRINKVRPFEMIETSNILNEIKLNMSDQIKESNAIIKYDKLPKIYGDTVLIGQLFQNLVGNAIKFRGDERPEITINGEVKNGEYLFSVKDNGIGLKSEYFDKIFIIFQRLNSREKYEGTGIGLSICKKIIERHGGKIWVESEPGKGSVFYFTLKQPHGN